MKNNGTSTWTAANLYRLGSQNPQDNTTWTTSNRILLGPTESIAPNAQKVFTFGVKAPSTAGTYNFQWQMVRDGVAFFGEKSTNVAISVTPPPPPTVGPVTWTLGPGGIADITINGVNLLGTQNTPHFDGGSYLIGGCNTVDGQKNIHSFFGEGTGGISIGETKTFPKTMRTLDGSSDCLGPTYNVTYYRPFNNSLIMEVSIGGLPQQLTTLSWPMDLIRDDSNNEFRFSRNDFKMVNTQCNGEIGLTGFGRFYRDIPQSCPAGPEGAAGYAVALPPLSELRWCSVNLNLCVVEKILSGNFKRFRTFRHWGTHNLEPSWQPDNSVMPVGSTYSGKIQIDIVPRQ